MGPTLGETVKGQAIWRGRVRQAGEALGRCNASPDLFVFFASANATLRHIDHLRWMAVTAGIVAFSPRPLASPPPSYHWRTWSSGGGQQGS